MTPLLDPQAPEDARDTEGVPPNSSTVVGEDGVGSAQTERIISVNRILQEYGMPQSLGATYCTPTHCVVFLKNYLLQFDWLMHFRHGVPGREKDHVLFLFRNPSSLAPRPVGEHHMVISLNEAGPRKNYAAKQLSRVLDSENVEVSYYPERDQWDHGKWIQVIDRGYNPYTVLLNEDNAPKNGISIKALSDKVADVVIDLVIAIHDSGSKTSLRPLTKRVIDEDLTEIIRRDEFFEMITSVATEYRVPQEGLDHNEHQYLQREVTWLNLVVVFNYLRFQLGASPVERVNGLPFNPSTGGYELGRAGIDADNPYLIDFMSQSRPAPDSDKARAWPFTM